jgi:hypothetical protein
MLGVNAHNHDLLGGGDIVTRPILQVPGFKPEAALQIV